MYLMLYGDAFPFAKVDLARARIQPQIACRDCLWRKYEELHAYKNTNIK